MGVRRGIGAEGDAVRFGSVAQVVKNRPGLDTGQPVGRVDVQHAIHVFREVEDHSGVAALAGQTGAAASSEDWRLMRATDVHGTDDIVDLFRNDHANRRLPVVRTVSGIEGPAAFVESNLAVDGMAQVGRESIAGLWRGGSRVDVSTTSGGFLSQGDQMA